ncbi:MAG: arginase family protein [Candidatus Hydrothermales bacterium]
MKFFGKDKIGSNVILKGVPFEYFSPFSGCALAPSFLRYCSEYIETKSLYFDRFCENFEDKGDIPCFGVDLKEASYLIEENVLDIFKSKKTAIFIGGDHTITFFILRSIKKIFPDLKVLIFDAHTDFRDTFMDSKINHATWLKRLYEEKVVKDDDVFLFGIREKFPETPFKVLNKIDLMNLSGRFYLSFDLDVLNPNIFPSVTNPVPGGFDFEEIINLLKEIKDIIVSADFVEYNPLRGDAILSGINFSTLIREFIVLKSL